MRPPADVPVLMIAFNRPEKTRRVFEAVRAAAPRRLYLAADGPRADVPSDADRCERTRRVLDDITWPCEVQRLYQPSNLGCKRGVAAAIDWFLTHEDSGIILEDDCVPTADFFPFCAELLERYRDNPEVMMIGGHNEFGTWDATEASYLFSRTAPIWGWATWRRAWDRYDPAMTSWGEPETRAPGPVEDVACRVPHLQPEVRQCLRRPPRLLGLRLDAGDAGQRRRLDHARQEPHHQHRLRQRGHPHPTSVAWGGCRAHAPDPAPAPAPTSTTPARGSSTRCSRSASRSGDGWSRRSTARPGTVPRGRVPPGCCGRAARALVTRD